MQQVVGYKAALACLYFWAASFEEANDGQRMTIKWPRAVDDNGSGEYYRAICTNINTAQSAEEEIYQIVSGH